MEQKSICHIITQGELGGAQRYVFDLATNLPQTKWLVTVLIGENGGDLKQRLEEAGVNVIVVKNLVRSIHPLKDILAVREISQILKELRPDIVHLNSSKAGVVGSIAARLAGRNHVIFTAHGFAFLEPHNWLTRQIYLRAEKFATKIREKIIAVSEFDRQEAIKRKIGPAEKFITIHNGIPSKPTSYKLIPNSSPIIGTIAHDYPTKDLKTLRQAFALVKQSHPKAELVIIGRGGTMGEIPDASSHLQNFDIYVCSSVKEGLPYTILEAAAAGLPIVSTAVGGIPEIISPHPRPTRFATRSGRVTSPGEEGCGILVPPKNPEALAQAIKFLIENPKTAKALGANARERVRDFSLEKMLAKTERLYLDICFS